MITDQSAGNVLAADNTLKASAECSQMISGAFRDAGLANGGGMVSEITSTGNSSNPDTENHDARAVFSALLAIGAMTAAAALSIKKNRRRA